MDSSNSERFGEFVRTRRTSLGMSVRSLAKEIGVSPGYVSSFESGLHSPPTIDRIQLICQALDLDVETLVELAGRWVELVARETEARPTMLRLFRISRNLTDEQIEHLAERAIELGSSRS